MAGPPPHVGGYKYYEVQLSSHLPDWPEAAVLLSAEDDGTTTTRTYRDTQPFDVSERRFMRLEVNRW